MNWWMKKWGCLMLGLPKNKQEPYLSPLPMPILRIRDPVKGKGVAPLEVPTKMLLYS